MDISKVKWIVITLIISIGCPNIAIRQRANHLGGMLIRSCMYGFQISGLESQFMSEKFDRLWHIDCAPVPEGDKQHTKHFCQWTYEFVNSLGGSVKFECDENWYLTGMYSDYNVSTSGYMSISDRVWRMECCNSTGIQLTGCHKGDWSNAYKRDLNVTLPPNKAIQGVTSIYSQKKRDRKWKFTICDITDSN